MALPEDKIVTLITITEEISRRYNNFLEKEAQYEARASELVPRIIRNLKKANVINDEQENALQESLTKSATATLEVLNDLVNNLHASSSTNSLGQPYTPRKYNSRFDIPEHIDVSDFVIDASRLK